VDDGLDVFDAGVTLNPSEMIRIVLPPQQSEGEGGAIDLAALLGPSSLLAAGSNAALASARPGATPTHAASGETASYVASENLRARAVVYNVALIDEAAGSPSLASPSEKVQAAAPAGAAHEKASPTRRPVSPRGEAVERRATKNKSEATPNDAEQAALEADVAKPVEAAPRTGDASEAPAADETARLDAAFGSWDNELASLESKERDGALSLASTRERTLVGLAVAAAIGAPAVIRRTRRPKSNPAPEQAAGLR
jgi:hypothetical protein